MKNEQNKILLLESLCYIRIKQFASALNYRLKIILHLDVMGVFRWSRVVGN